MLLTHSECSSSSQTLSDIGHPGPDTFWSGLQKVIDLEVGKADLSPCRSLAFGAGKVWSSQRLTKTCQKP